MRSLLNRNVLQWDKKSWIDLKGLMTFWSKADISAH